MIAAQAVNSLVVIRRLLGVEINQNARRGLRRHHSFSIGNAENVSGIVEELIMSWQNRVVFDHDQPRCRLAELDRPKGKEGSAEGHIVFLGIASALNGDSVAPFS